jgi:hypothetical protein
VTGKPVKAKRPAEANRSQGGHATPRKSGATARHPAKTVVNIGGVEVALQPLRAKGRIPLAKIRSAVKYAKAVRAERPREP